MAWNPENLQRYEDEMREKRNQQAASAAREADEWEIQSLRGTNTDLLAACRAARHFINEAAQDPLNVHAANKLDEQLRKAIARAEGRT